MELCTLIATTTFGLESIIKQEIKNLGFEILQVEDGKITFSGDLSAIPKANLWLRSADRILLKIGEFNALTFTELFEETKSLPWERWIPVDGKFTVNGKSVKSKLFSISDCQSIVKKAVVDKLSSHYNVDWFKETGAEYTIQVSILKDIATLTIDTTGIGLHKRGYRKNAVSAPLKETLAAALVQLSYWNNKRLLLDPFCGSGTIPIEAALIGRNIAPGLTRNFVSEEWSSIPADLWKHERVNAYQAIHYDQPINILASDIDQQAIELAKENAEEAGVDDCISFSLKDIADIQIDNNYGIMITNPPYGVRIGDKKELIGLYKNLRRIFRNKNTWSLYLITADERFVQTFGSKPSKTRKLYNGRIQVNYYQYFGKRPPK